LWDFPLVTDPDYELQLGGGEESKETPIGACLLAFIHGLWQTGHYEAAISLSVAILVGSPPIPNYLARLPQVDQVSFEDPITRQALAESCVSWLLEWSTKHHPMHQDHATSPSSQALPSLIEFIRQCKDYDGDKISKLLLAKGHVREALEASAVAGGEQCLGEILITLSQDTCLPVGPEEIAWISDAGYGKALLHSAQRGWRSSLDDTTQVDAILATSGQGLHGLEFIGTEAYDWLLVTMPYLPKLCLQKLVRVLLELLHVPG